MGFGRFICVALPFLLTVASLLCILIAMLSGTTNNQLEMFDVNFKNMSISTSSLASLAKIAKREAEAEPGTGLNGLTATALNGASGSDTTNFTASQFGLSDTYKVYMWNYCSTNTTSGTKSKSSCSKIKFNWAASTLNTTELNEKASAISMAVAGVNATLPKDITTALKAYSTVSKWTQVVYIIAFILSVLTLITGLFGFCSRAGSCVTYIISGLATTSIIAASLMATLSSSIVVAAVKASAKIYGVTATLNTKFLSITWLAVAFAIGSGLFWLFSVCCCKSEHRKGKGNEKFGPSSYTPIGENHGQMNNSNAYNGQAQGTAYNHQMQPVQGAGYEPYKHANV